MARNNAKRATRPNPRDERNNKKNRNNVISVNFSNESKPVKKIAPLVPKTLNQEDMLDALNDANTHIVIASGCAGTGKAQPLDSKILTPNGWETMGDMEIDSKVISPSGKISNVIGVFPQGEKDVYKITFSDGRSTECCKEHLWRVFQYSWKNKSCDGWKVLSTEEIMNTSSKIRRKYKIQLIEDKIEGEEDIDLPIDPYIMGYMLGNAHFGNSISISIPDNYVVDKFNDILGIDGYFLKHNGKYDYSIRSKLPLNSGTAEILHKYKTLINSVGLSNKLSYDKFIPEVYKSSSRKQRLELIRGLIDSDGTVDKTGSISFSTSSQRLSEDFSYMIRSIGGISKTVVKSTSYTYNGELKKGRVSYTSRVRYSNPKTIVSLPRKQDRISNSYQYKDCLKLDIVDIQKSRKCEAKCIMLDSVDNLYITDDFIVTHNTFIASHWAVSGLMKGEFDKIFLVRPNIGCDDEQIGHLPGDVNEKMFSILSSIWDALELHYTVKEIEQLVEDGKIVPLPLAFIRGRSLSNACVILEEAQGTTPNSMLALLTRISTGSKIVVTGDTKQKDRKTANGLEDLIEKLNRNEVDGIEHIEFDSSDIQRHPIISDVLKLYEE